MGVTSARCVSRYSVNVASSMASRLLPGQPAQNGSRCDAVPDVEQGLENRQHAGAAHPHDYPPGSPGSSRAAGLLGAAPDAQTLLRRVRGLALEMVSALQHASREKGYEESLLLPDSSDGNEAFTDR